MIMEPHQLISSRFRTASERHGATDMKGNMKVALGLLATLLLALVTFEQPAMASDRTDDDPDRQFQAGAAIADITSPLGIPVVGGWRPAPATHVHDRLHVRTLVLDDGDTRVAFAICDLLGVPQEVSAEAKRLIEEQSGLPAGQVAITGTHTHSAGSPFSYNGGTSRLYRPTGDLNDYQRFVAKRIADAVHIAINNLEPAQIGWATAEEPSQVFNRRWYVGAEELRRNPFGGVDRVRMNPPAASPELIESAGPTDPEIVFLSVQSREGRPIALLANYSLHYIGGVPAATISADYFGVFAERIQHLIGADEGDTPFIGILSNGTSGDINNINFSVSRESRAPYEKMHEVADMIATKVYHAYQNMEYQDWVKLDSRYEEIPLRRRDTPDEMLAYAHQILEKPEDADVWHGNEALYANRVLQLSGTPETWSIPLQAFRIGDLGIAAIPAEVFVEIGLEIKERTPFTKSFTLSLANGYEGYLPTVAQHEVGGYETWTSTNRLEIEAAPKIIDKILGFFQEME